ncbi:hypothetical protein AU210_012345 [Fusarium oxysporum f. sp. radicis-cucumerinum]|uniref:Uncharacterized protein n=1 Tax=Fusarium oxysporum f. sp. radicis-cucumerinum TaxID=327505 RepID=A0A2H3G5C7_FUSOX|nr:hypothetical protein AU210_012345 [Fusarium oxysporum f. sp. radicis-cucumerinum]
MPSYTEEDMLKAIKLLTRRSEEPKTADTDKQLDQDEEEAIDKSNIIKNRTRHAQPQGSYEESSDEKLGLTE